MFSSFVFVFVFIFGFISMNFIEQIESKSMSNEFNGTIKEMNCTKQIDGRTIVNGESIELNGKIYKMEDCQLDRAYHACGKHLLTILSIVCEIIHYEKQIFHSSSNNSTRFSSSSSSSSSKLKLKSSHHIQKRFSRRKLLTEACCLNLCTIHEMTRYCPLK